MESMNSESVDRGTQNPPPATWGSARASCALASGVGQKPFGAQPQEIMAVCVAELFGNHEQARGGRGFEDIGNERRRGGLGRVGCVHDVNGGVGHGHFAQIRSERGFELPRGHIERRTRKCTREFGEHQRVRGQDADLERTLGGDAFHNVFTLHEMASARQARRSRASHIR